jgi:hypothetical protein
MTTTAPIEIQLHTLHPGQRRVLDHPARFKIVRCGRRYGKTALGIYRACRRALEGKKVGWFAPTNKYALEAWREIVRRLRPMADLPGGRVSEQEKRIELPNGGLVEVWSFDANDDPARGRSYDDAIVDEAGLVGKLQMLWESAIEPTLIDRDGSALFLGTPKGARTPFNVMHAVAAQGDDEEWAAFDGHTADNITIKDVVIKVERARKRAEKRGTLALWLQEYCGVPADDGSNPIGLEAIKAAVAPRSTGEVVAWGVDLAKAIDWTVAIGLDAYGRWAHVERFQADWGTTKRRLKELIGTTTPVVMDATGVGSPIVADLQWSGMQVEPFVFSRRSRGLLIEDLITGIHAKALSIPDGLIRAELESLGVDYNSETGFTRYEVPDGMTDDGIMALAMAWRCYQQSAEAPQWAPLPEQYDADLDPAFARHGSDEFSGLGDGW